MRSKQNGTAISAAVAAGLFSTGAGTFGIQGRCKVCCKNIHLETIDGEPVLIFTTELEDHSTVPLVCDPERKTETCLISETEQDGICFCLKDTPEGICLSTGKDSYLLQTNNK